MQKTLDKALTAQTMAKQASKQASGTTVFVRLLGRFHSYKRGQAHLLR